VKQLTAVLLTYVCDNTRLTRERIKEFLVALKKSDKVLVVEEATREGKTHFHAVAYRKARFAVRHMTYFDIEGEHPNIRVVGKEGITKPIQYCMKTGFPVSVHNVDLAAYRSEPAVSLLRLNSIAKETGYDFEESCSVFSQQKDVKVRDWAASIAYLRSICREPNRYFHASTKYRKEDFEYPKAIEKYFSTYVNAPVKYDRYPVLVVSGLTRRGKTSAIRAMGPHLYFKGDVDLCSFANVPPSCKFVVLDDISNEDLETYLKMNALMLAMEDGWTQKFLYVGKKPVENTCPVIILQNTAHECFTDPKCTKYISTGYYYSNSIHVDVKQHMPKHLRQLEKDIVEDLKPRLKFFSNEDDVPDDCDQNRRYIESYFKEKLNSGLAKESSELEMQLDAFHSMAMDFHASIFGETKCIHQISMMLRPRAEPNGKMNWAEKALKDAEKALKGQGE
jgi:hypothetical protein